MLLLNQAWLILWLIGRVCAIEFWNFVSGYKDISQELFFGSFSALVGMRTLWDTILCVIRKFVIRHDPSQSRNMSQCQLIQRFPPHRELRGGPLMPLEHVYELCLAFTISGVSATTR